MPQAQPAVPPGNEMPGYNVFDLVILAWARISQSFDKHADRFIPNNCIHSADSIRRSRFLCRFGILGAIFGAIYATFYTLIGHEWGAAVIVVCSFGFGAMPFLLKRTGSLDFAGNVLSFILILGFSVLCFMEGGINGHAIAWLASVPLCAMLLLGRTGAGRWMIASFCSCSAIAALNLFGFKMTPTYDPKWEGIVSIAGYLGFILFMFALGVIFETSRKRAFRDLQNVLANLEVSNAALLRLNQEKNEFLGIAAHDLKNPLSVVICAAELMRSPQDPEKKERLINNIVHAGGRMLHFIKNLLDVNAIEEGRFISKIERCDLRALLEQCIQDNATSGARKEIRLLLETEGPCWASADRNAAAQILDNLVSNALKYSPNKTTVHLGARAQGDKAVLFIRDEGPGIGEEDFKKMFGKFARLSARPTGGESSNGLGLSIVKRLAEAMSGTVRCESRLGQGATFILELPACE